MTSPELKSLHPDSRTFYSVKTWPPPKWVHADDYARLYEIAREYERRVLRDEARDDDA